MVIKRAWDREHGHNFVLSLRHLFLRLLTPKFTKMSLLASVVFLFQDCGKSSQAQKAG